MFEQVNLKHPLTRFHILNNLWSDKRLIEHSSSVSLCLCGKNFLDLCDFTMVGPGLLLLCVSSRLCVFASKSSATWLSYAR